MEPFGSADAAETQAYTDELRATFMRLRNDVPAVYEKARAVQITEKSRDGLITATVGARGDLVRLDIDPRVYRRPDSRELADCITQTIHRAAARAQEKVIELFAPLIPAEQMRAHLAGDLERVLDQMADRMHGKE